MCAKCKLPPLKERKETWQWTKQNEKNEKEACRERESSGPTPMFRFPPFVSETNNSVYRNKVAKEIINFIVLILKFLCNVLSGAIIRDGDRKSWDARGPMIWDNFSIFRTNCAILTSYIRAYPRTCLELSRGCCHFLCNILEWLSHIMQNWKFRDRINGSASFCLLRFYF